MPLKSIKKCGLQPLRATDNSSLSIIRSVLFLSNETRTQGPERGRNAAVVHRYDNENVLVGVLQDADLNLVLPASELDFVSLFVAEFSQELRIRLRTPFLDLSIEHRPPLLSTFHGSSAI